MSSGEQTKQQKSAIKITLVIIVVVVLISLFISFMPLNSGVSLKQSLEQKNVLLFDSARSVPEVSLKRHDGRAFTSQQFSGKWDLVNFGYTYCPDICPTNLADMKVAYRLLEEKGFADQVNFWMVTVDPERDTEHQLSLYVPFFHPDFVGLTGDPDSIATLATQLSAVYYREGEGEGYTVAHSDNYAIIDPNGEFVALMRPPHRPVEIESTLVQLIESQK